MRPEFALKLCDVAAVVHEPQHPAEDGRETCQRKVDSSILSLTTILMRLEQPSYLH